MKRFSMPELIAEQTWLRPLRVSDLAQASEISSLAGWNQTLEDWRMLLELAPDGCLVVEADGRVAATATLVCYGTRLAWVGMVLTTPEYQRRGFARRLVAALLARADALGIESVMLDATEQGAPLYEALGFRAVQAVERWSRVGVDAAEMVTSSSPSIGAWWSGDADVFGADRSQPLQVLAGRGCLTLGAGGYLLSRAGRVSRYLGPCVAESGDVAGAMIERCLGSEAASSWMWDLLPRNREATRLAATLGFSPARRLVRMVRGREVQERTDQIFAIAGFELG